MSPPALATATNTQRSLHRIPHNDRVAQLTSSQLTAQMQPVRRGPRITSRTTTTQCTAQMQPVRRGQRGGMGGGMGGWVGLRVGFININHMYNNDVCQGVVYAYEAYEAK